MFHAPVYYTGKQHNRPSVDVVHHGNVQVHGAQIPLAVAQPLTAVALQGTGVFGNTLVTDLQTLQRYVEGYDTLEALAAASCNIKGSVCYQVYDTRTRRIALLNDPLGGGIYFEHKAAQMRAVSSHTLPLRQLLGSMGLRINRTSAYSAAEMATGSACYGADSPYEDINVLPAGYGLIVDFEGRWREVSYGPTSFYDMVNDNNYADLLELAAQEITQNFQAIGSAPADLRIADLTGGFDSRLILAGLLHTGQQENYYYHCLKGSADWNIASSLAAEFSLTLTDSFGNPLALPIPYNYYAEKTHSSTLSDGVLNHTYASRFHPWPVVGLQGGYGETLRTFNSLYWTTESGTAEDLAFAMWRWADFPAPQEVSTSLFDAGFINRLIGRVDTSLSSAKEAGLNLDTATNIMYLRGRNRYWFGQNSFYSSAIRFQFDPLYSVAGAAAALNLPFFERRANFLGLDLMRKWHPTLASLPFDRQIVFPSYEKSRGSVSRIPFSDNHVSELKSVRPCLGANAPGILGSQVPNDPPESRHTELAVKLKQRPLVIYGIDKYRDDAIEALYSSQSLSDVYNPANCAQLLRNAFDSTDSVVRADKLLTALIRTRAF